MSETISVVLAVYNGERFVADAIDSIRSQSHLPLEIIVIDDGSSDGTPGQVAQFPDVRYIRQPNAGQPAALNAGIQLARGSLLAFNDADDLWMPTKLARQLEALVEDGQREAIFGHAEQFLEADAPPAVAAGLTEERRVIPSQLPTAMLIRRTAFDRVGPFNESQRIGAVVDWYHRATAAGLRTFMLPDIVIRRRLHADNLGWQQRAVAKEAYLDVIRNAIARRRDAATPE
jgi:glycosyltransferase involved in cell wall biosynthesis